MKTQLDLLSIAQTFALETIDADPSPELHFKTAERFKEQGGNEADWPLWLETVNTNRARYRLLRDDKLPSQLTAPKPA